MTQKNGKKIVIQTTPSGQKGAFHEAYEEAVLKDMPVEPEVYGQAQALDMTDLQRSVNEQVSESIHKNEAMTLLDQLGVSGEEKPDTIPCGYKEPISEGKTLTCGTIYRGQTFYCRQCMSSMLSNAHEITNGLAEMVLVAVNDHAKDGVVAESTIDNMRGFLTNIGCIEAEPTQSH